MQKIKPAATIMLGRDHQGQLEILLLKRNKALAFAGGLWVFPGGKIEPAEIAQASDDLEAAKYAAIRETKEEADVDIDIHDLQFFRHWTTPAIQPKRFATWFFFAGINAHTSTVTIDDSEIKNHCWITPEAALAKVGAPDFGMLPPTIMSLQLIRKCKNVAAVKEKLSKEKPIFVLPVLKMKGSTMICLYEGDAGYTTGKEELSGSRHRLILDLAQRKFTFQYQDCDPQYPPVNGGMHI